MSLKIKLILPFMLLIALCVGGGLVLSSAIRDGLAQREQSFLINQTLNDAISQLEASFSSARVTVRDAARHKTVEEGEHRFSEATRVLRSNLELLSHLPTSDELRHKVTGATIELALWEATAASIWASPDALDRFHGQLVSLEKRFLLSLDGLKRQVAAESATMDKRDRASLTGDLYTAMAMIVAVALAAAGLAFYVSTSISRPLVRLIRQAGSIANGDSRLGLSPLQRKDEIGMLSQALARMLQSLQFHICEIEQVAYSDPQTGLPNKHKLLQAARDALETHNEPATLLVIDLDPFGRLEDAFGASFVDDVVRLSAQRVHERVAAEMPDARGDGKVLIARSEETRLAVLICGETAADQPLIERFIEGLFSDLDAPIEHEGRHAKFAARVSMAAAPRDAETADALLGAANMARQTGQDDPSKRLTVFDPAMREAATQRRILEERLGEALERDEFELHFQPKISCARPTVVGVEALIRWRKPGEGLTPPGLFIPVAEETGLIARIDDWVMAKACQQAKHWLDEGLDLSVAVNVSASRFEQDGFVETVQDCLMQSGLPADHLELELTETLAMADPAHTAALLAPLRAMGVRVSIDDFGAGYSSLSKLSALPIDCVKIDRSLLPADAQDRDSATIMEAAVGMARSLGLHTVAEGVETTWQHAYLQSLGCNVIQGFLFSRPLTAESLETFARTFDPEAIQAGAKRSESKAASAAKAGEPGGDASKRFAV